MLKKYPYYLLVTISVFLILSLIYINRENLGEKDVVSPLPDFLTKKVNSQVSSLDLWFPFLSQILPGEQSPVVSAKSALVYDLTEEKVIYEKNAKEKLPMASLTKLMTAMVAIDNKRSDNRYYVYPENLVGENVMGLSEGEVMTLENLLYGVFMYSGNDAAEALATNTMNRADFILAMNNKAKSLGAINTNFTNPTGLEGDGDQYTTAYDLLIIARHAVSNYPQIVKASSTPEHHIPATSDHYAYDMYNQTNLITSYPGVKGLKDGYTPEAGLCLITYLDYEGHKLIGIILGSENRRQEMKDLLDYSLSSQGIKPPPHS
jgi:serine-type D-Ala-D-Ala carboxypeptidase (penicillin-binding protein 5/6)